MSAADVIDQIGALLDSDDSAGAVTSVRIPEPLRQALTLATDHLGFAATATSLTAAALRDALEACVLGAALEAHYAEFPAARPSIVDIAEALAAQDGSPLAERRDLLAVGAEALLARHPAADARDLLLWVEAQDVALAE